MASPRILRQIFAHHQTEVQRDAFVFVNHQLRFNQRGELLANFVKLFVFQIRREFPGNLFVTQRHLFIAHIQQTIGAGVSQRPRGVKVGLDRLTQTLGEDAVFIHIDSGTDKFVHVAIVADPQVNRLLAPADDTVQFTLQIED